MLFVATIALLASAAYAFPQAGGMMGGMGNTALDANGNPIICCPPPVWQANLIHIDSAPNIIVTVMAKDDNQKKEGTKTVSLDGSAFYAQSFIDHNTNMEYTVKADGSCTVGKTTFPFDDGCMGGTSTNAKNVQFIGSGSLAGKLPFNAYSMEYAGLNITLGLSKDGCIPIMETVMDDPNKRPTTLLFDHVSTTISDMSLLNIPAACSGNSVVG